MSPPDMRNQLAAAMIFPQSAISYALLMQLKPQARDNLRRRLYKNMMFRTHRFLKITGIVLLLLVLFVAAAIFLLPGQMHHIVSDKGSTALGRKFSVDGPVHIDWNWSAPTIELNQVKLANMEGAPEPDMLSIDQLKIQVRIWKLLEGQMNIPNITLVNPVIVLEKFDADTKNWNFPTVSSARSATHTVVPTKSSNFPIIGKLDVQNGTLTYRDKTVGLDTTLQLTEATGSSQDEFHLNGNGTLHGQTFSVDASGGSLEMLRASKEDYPLSVDIKMGKTEIKVDGKFHDIVNMAGVDTTVAVHGDNLADIFYITGIPLPPSPVYSFSAHLQEANDLWHLTDLKGKLGESDIEGDITYDTSPDRSYMKGTINATLLRMVDLGGFIGAKTDKPAAPSDKLLPDVPIDLTRLRASDADVDFRATRINQPGWPIDNMDTHIHLKDGLLHIDPLTFGVAGGKISGSLTLDGQKDVPLVEADLLLEGLTLKRFFEHTSFESLSSGHFGGRFQIAGHGKSLADVMADADGRVGVVMSGGTISKLIVDAAGLDIARAAPEFLDQDQKTEIRCAIMDFKVQKGILNSDTFTFDTTASRIDGDMKINFKDETIDGEIEGHPKAITISGQIPITISGPLRSPSI
ncbi:MAG TPA: AsmA family protein, partial [Alphaproteobacteria bacterium]|nr:AsmA family protein [Alphaproteobacteria bacterium]